MKKYLKISNIIYSVIMSLLASSFILIRKFPYLLFIVIPLFIFINLFAGIKNNEIESFKLKVCQHGSRLLSIFILSLIPVIIYHIILAFIKIPDDYITLIYSAIYCILLFAIIFWNGISCVYCTSVQMGIKWRIIGIVCGMIPIINLLVLNKILDVVHDEIEFETEKEIIDKIEGANEMCKTKYPILLVHGVFFRDSNLFNYWGRIPRALKIRGAQIYYGQHQSALSIKESARELAYRIKLIVDRSGCEKVNIIAHSKGGLDCRYAICEFGVSNLVASLTTINTPHRGCIFADNLLNAAPENLKTGVSKAYNTALKAIGDEEPDFLAAVTDLTANKCIELDKSMIIPDGIYTQSVGSIMSKAKSGRFPLNLSYKYVKNFDGENDGLVGETSFRWGEKYTLLRTEGNRGISHGDMIDLNRENLKDFDVRKFYVDLVSDLKKHGL